jgi:ferredoxin-thioredoxin reductase catalytic subunit
VDYKELVEKYAEENNLTLSNHSDKIISRLGKTEGQCPCVKPETYSEDTMCPCKKMREEDYCCCGLYLTEEENNKLLAKNLVKNSY